MNYKITCLNTSVNVCEYGNPDGFPLLLVHGFRGDNHGLQLFACQLAARVPVRILVPDLPGFGDSSPLMGTHSLANYGQFLAALPSALGLQNYALVAHSFGTLVTSAALAAGASPEATVLLNPISASALAGPRAVLTKAAVAYYRLAALLPSTAGAGLLAHPLIVRLMSELMAKTADPLLRRWIHDQHAKFFSNYANRQVVLEAFAASVSGTVTENSQFYTMPTQIIAGAKDDITSLAQQLELARKINARLHVVGGVGHLVHYEAAVEAGEVAAEFLRVALSL